MMLRGLINRKLIHISGQEQWCLDATKTLLKTPFGVSQKFICCGIENNQYDRGNITYLNNSKKRSEIENYLGAEFSVLVFNCFAGFNPELFCALIGMVRSPGLVLLLTPNLDEWPKYPDPDYSRFCSYPYSSNDIEGRFINYFVNKLNQQNLSNWSHLISQNRDNYQIVNCMKTNIHNYFTDITLSDDSNLQITSDQRKVINSIQSMVKNNKHEILVICGHRGRGKSTSVGLAIANLIDTLSSLQTNITVISQTRKNVASIFKQIFNLIDQISITNKIQYKNIQLEFLPPDEYLKKRPITDMLVIDEAAAIPLAILKRLIEQNSKVVLSTTTDGYEGTGMGFTTKFKSYLAGLDHTVIYFELKESLRWNTNDELEKFLTDSLLPKRSESEADTEIYPENLNIDELNFQKIDRNELVQNSEKIQQIYGLLAQAHYRTTPDDLRYLLDAPDVELWVASKNDQMFATLMMCNEGNLDNKHIDSIWLGKRRLQGHLIPQSLSAHCGFKQAVKFSYKRIVRIAVDANYRKLGISTRLINSVISEFNNQQTELDFICVSYGLEPKLFRFWRKLDFSAVRIGHRANARSGLNSMIMLLPLSTKAKHLNKILQNRFNQDLIFNSAYQTHDMATLDIQSLSNFNELENNSYQDKLDVYAFAFGHRQYSSCQNILFKLADQFLNSTKNSRNLTEQQVKLVTYKVLQNVTWAQSARLLGFSGHQETLSSLRQVYATIYNIVWGNKS